MQKLNNRKLPSPQHTQAALPAQLSCRIPPHLGVHVVQAKHDLHELGHDFVLGQQPPSAPLQVPAQVALLRGADLERTPELWR